ncbi:MAG: hypothetical protein AMDU1_APLC00020G0012 [Thermoplasmatales archaeon A-plasma]|nr:MAG: hypothetical protein AMDU1_APLC00020G0012 [Thermoplasmatales archaeon A-plasma]
MNKEEVEERLNSLKESLLKERASVAMGGAPTNPGKIRSLRRQIRKDKHRPGIGGYQRMKDKNFTGLPKELQPWEGFTRDNQTWKFSVDKRRYGKFVTIVDGIDPKSENIQEMPKELKKKVASGGTVKDGKTIELQGDHRNAVKKYLEDMGFKIEVV